MNSGSILIYSQITFYNIVNGKVASTNDVNVHDAVKIGQEMQKTFIASLADSFHISINKKVKTMQVLKRGIKVKRITVYDLEAVFARLMIVGQKRNLELYAVFQHELCPMPPSLVNEYAFLGKGNKSMLVNRLGVIMKNRSPPDTLLVDASQLLYHIVWSSSGTVSDLAEGIKSRLINYNQTKIISSSIATTVSV